MIITKPFIDAEKVSITNSFESRDASTLMHDIEMFHIETNYHFFCIEQIKLRGNADCTNLNNIQATRKSFVSFQLL